MKSIIKNITLLICSALLIFSSCNEELGIDVKPASEFEISEFSPTSATPLALISVKGQGLGAVNKAYIVTTDNQTIALQIKEIITNNSITLQLPANARSGILHLENGKDIIQGALPLSIIYPEPQVTMIPSTAKVGSEIEIVGTNLAGVSKVLVGSENAPIRFNNGQELIVTIPFVLEDHASLKLEYTSATGTNSYEAKSDFEVVKPLASIEALMSQNVKEGQLIILQGENLNLIEKVMFGTVSANSIVKTATTLSFRVPTLNFGNNVVDVTAFYYSDTKNIELRNNCNVFVPKVFHYTDILLGAHRQTDTGNLFCGEKGEVFFSCLLKSAGATPNDPKSIADMKSLDFSGYANASGEFTLYGPDNTGSTLKNYWCDGKTFAKGGTIEALKEEGYTYFVDTQTRFLVLSTANAAQKAIIDDVVAGTITEISASTYPALFDGTISPSSKTAKWGATTSTTVFNAGSVVLYVNNTKNVRGLLYIKALEGAGNATGRLTFDTFVQR